MKLNWGHKLAITMTLFIGFIVTLGIIMGTNNDSIEEANYYEKGLHYDNQIDMEKNTKALLEKPVILFDANTNSLIVERPAGLNMVETDLLLYKPDAKSSDIHVDVTELRTQTKVAFSMADMPHGKWIAKFNWSDGKQEYYLEQSFIKQ
jgi:nitrogen fixation protein FixH